MKKPITADLCVIGAGSGGLSVAAGAAQLGASTVLIERHKMGGDCLNYGCVPSKSLIAAASSVKEMRFNPILNITRDDLNYDYLKVRDHVRRVIAKIEPHDSVERFEGLGVQVIKGSGAFISSDQVSVGDHTISAKRFVIATGSRPRTVPIAGLDQIHFETNETIFELDQLPDHLLVIGGGPIGCELAQAFRRLGAQVSLFDIGPILPKDDPEMVKAVRQGLEIDGVHIFDQVKVVRIEPGPSVVIERDGKEEKIAGTNLLMAVGRQANLEELGLDKAGIETSKAGINVDRRLRTTNKNVYAIGDVTGGLQFTHVAGYQAGIVIRNALFRIPAKTNETAVPWVTYTKPELAQVGITQAEAEANRRNVEILSWSFEENDRAVAEGDTAGGIKVVVAKNGKILGASIAGAHAGELIFPWALALNQGMKISKIAGAIAPYPTRSEISKRAAGAYYTPRLFTKRMRGIVQFLLKLPF